MNIIKKRILLFLLVFLLAMGGVDQVLAADNNIPMTFRDGVGDPYDVDLDLRVSLWATYDVQAGDIDGSGNINTSAPNYASYQTTLTITPDPAAEGYSFANKNINFYNATGYYILDHSTLPSFPNPIGTDNLYLQLEYKLQGAANTDYLVYDFVADPPWDNIQRYILVDTVSILTTDAGSRTNNNTFTLDANNNAPTVVALQFGQIIAEVLKWDIANNRFELSDDLKVLGNLILGTGTAADSIITFDDGANRNFGWDDSEGAFSTFDQQLRFRTLQGATPPVACSATVTGMQWMDTDSGMIYVCDTSNGRNKWLTSADMILWGENSDVCDSGNDTTNDDGCVVEWGDGLGADTSTPALGFFIPHPITITGVAFSEDGDACSTGSFDLELRGTGSATSDSSYGVNSDLATLLTGETHNAINLNIDVAGAQYIIWGLDNNCGDNIDDWNMLIYYRWRHG